MSRFLCVPTELDRLDASLTSHLDRASLDTAATVLDTLRLRPDRPRRWTRRLSPIVVLYPLLQAECWARRPEPRAREANEVHLLLLIYSFIDDRRVDGQGPLAPREIALARDVLGAAMRVLEARALRTPAVDRAYLDALARYHRAQRSAPGPDGSTTGERLRAREAIVADRAALGAVGAMAACDDAGCAGLQPVLRQAYDRLVIGLQWEDDLADWRHDVLAAQDNLVLSRLPGPVTSRAVRTGALDEVEDALRQTGAHAASVARATACLREAESLQRRVGCRQLADEIRRRRLSVDRQSFGSAQ